MPLFRGRQQEILVLKSFDFEDRIYPCIEIIKELPRKPPKPRESAKPNFNKKRKTFESEYLELIGSIKAKKIFIDLPVQLKTEKNMPDEVIDFLTRVVRKRELRTEYIKKLTPYANKVIPIISSFYDVNREQGSISKQEKELRPIFPNLAFRCFSLNTLRDIDLIQQVAKDNDYLLMDWEEIELDQDEQIEVISELKKMKCTVIIHRNPFPLNLTNSGLKHGKIVESIDNSLHDTYSKFAGHCFSDFAGIKKGISEGGMISPGFVYYDAVDNTFYGFRYKNGGHKRGETPPDISEFETTIVPAIIACEATMRMQSHSFDYLGASNMGWKTIKNIELGENNGGQSWKKCSKI